MWHLLSPWFLSPRNCTEKRSLLGCQLLPVDLAVSQYLLRLGSSKRASFLAFVGRLVLLLGVSCHSYASCPKGIDYHRFSILKKDGYIYLELSKVEVEEI